MDFYRQLPPDVLRMFFSELIRNLAAGIQPKRTHEELLKIIEVAVERGIYLQTKKEEPLCMEDDKLSST